MATDRTVLVRLKANPSDFVRGFAVAKAAVSDLTKEIDTSSDRTAWLAQGILALAPAVAPLGAAAVPVFTGLATQLTVAGVAAGTAALAFNGVGDALTALNNYQIDPTDAHLKKLNQTMDKVGPAGQEFVHFLDSVGPKLSGLSNIAREGLFPGVESGITNLLGLLPQVERIVSETSKTLGDLAQTGGAALAGPKFTAFFDFLEQQAQPILVEMGHAIGNLADGLAAMLVAFGPLSEDFSTGLAKMTSSFAAWAHGLQNSQSFQDFVAYIQDAGPKVRELLGAIADAIIQVVQAAAPVGDLMLPLFTRLFGIIGDIANTPLGPVFVAMGAAVGIYGRAVALASVSTGGFLGKMVNSTNGLKAQGAAALTAAGQLGIFESRTARLSRVIDGNMGKQAQATGGIKGFARATGPAALSAGLLALNLTGAGKGMGLTNTASLALMGTLAGPWGAAVGGAVGLMLDAKAAGNGFADAMDRARNATDTSAIEASIKELQGYLHDFQNTSSVGDFFGDAAASFGNALSHPFALHDNRAKDAKRQLDTLTRALDDVKTHTDIVTAADDHNAEAFRQQAAAMQATQTAASETGLEFTKFGKNLDDAKVSLDDWIASMAAQAQALTEFGANAEKAADRGLRKGLIKALEDAGPAGALRLKQLADGTETQIARANKAWRSQQRAIQDYEDILVGIPHDYVTRYHLDGTDEASAALRRIFRQVTQIPKKWKTEYIVTQITGLNKRGQGGGIDGNPDTPFAAGGYTGPGAKYQPAGVVHADEFVFSKEATHGNVAYLSALHQELRGYASGGYVAPVASGPAVDYDRLTQAVIAARPMFGDVHLSGDGAFEREQRARTAALGGVGRPTR